MMRQDKIVHSANLTKFLTDFLKENYGEETLGKHAETIKSLNDLRNVALCTPNESLEKRIELVYEYYIALKTIEPLLTLCEDPVKIISNFQLFADTSWYDISAKSDLLISEITDNRLSFEIANVLSFLVFLHSGINKNDKRYVEIWELIAGYLTEMKRYSQKDGLSSKMFTLSVDYTSVFINFYLCDAQFEIIFNIECDERNCWELLGMWNFVLSKTMDSLGIIKKNSVNSFDIKFSRSFHIQKQISLAKIFQIQSNIDMNEGRYYSSLANIKIGACHAERGQINNKESGLESLYYNAKKAFLESITNNKMFYPKVGTSSSSPPTGDTIKLVKPVIHNIESILNTETCLLMENMKGLSQIVVRKATQIFFAIITQIVETLSNSIEKNNNIFDSILSEINQIPYVEKHLPENISPSIVEKIEELSSEATIEFVTKKLMCIENLRNINKERLNKAWETLKREENNDANYQKKYFEAWPRSFSSKTTKLCRETLKTYEEYLIKSEKADNFINQQLASLKSFCLNIASSNDFSSNIKCKNNSIESSNLQLFCDVKRIYEEIVNLKVKQTNLLKSYTKTEKEIDSYFTSEFYKDCTTSLEAHVDALVDTFKPVKNELEESIENQESIVETLLSLNTRINNSECSKTYFGLVYTNYNLYKSIQKSIDDGLNFYNILGGNLDNLQSRIDDFCISRDAEAKEIIKSIEASLAPKDTNILDFDCSNTYSICHNKQDLKDQSSS